jgi:anti-anti-sigma regulatory factor
MNVRIISSMGSERAVIQVSGRLQSADLPELEKEIGSVDGRFVLDLSELLSADEAGIERLRELGSGRADLRGVSRYVQLLLTSNR